jgi:hypothetical protein
MNPLISKLAAGLIAAAFAGTSQAQTALLSENFENNGFVAIGGWGPQGLVNKGWIFTNNSQVQGPVAWVSGCCWDGLFSGLSGTGYLAAYQDSAAGGNPPQYSAWAVLPAVPNQQAGDVLTFYSVSSDTSPDVSVHLEVRYSASGGTNTGTTAFDVGDFTTTLLTLSPMPNYNQGLYDGWSKWVVELPGAGRIAFRQFGNESLYFGIDDVSVAPPNGTSLPMPQGFEDLGGTCGEAPCALVDNGWIFRDQGTYSQGPAWEPPYAVDDYTPHTGFSFMKSQKGSVYGGPLDGSGSISTWAILPELQSQSGEVLSFVVRGHLGADGAFQVRYSPTAGTDTGNGPATVGDFTQVLLEMTSIPTEAWQQVSVTLPGNGRVALRSYDPFEPFYDLPAVVAIDTMAINAEPVGPPLPQSGETVNWTVAMSPIEINTDLFVPAGGTIIVDPGVQILIDEESTLNIAGVLQGVGTRANPIVIESVANYPAGLLIPGTIDLKHAIINTQVAPTAHGSLLFDHCEFIAPNGLIYNIWAPILTLNDAPPFIKIDNCTFTNADLIPADAILRLTNTTFTDCIAWMNRGYWYIDNLEFNGGSLTIGRDQQNVYLDNITVQNAPGAAISVLGDNIGNDYFFGPNNVLVNNGFPVSATGGILAGSTLPKEGNNTNAVLVDPGEVEIRGPVNWHDPGIPYQVSPNNHLFLEAEVNMFEGVTMQFPQGIAIRESSNFSTRGLPDNPVRFEGLNGAQWWAIFTPLRMEHTNINGSLDGVVNYAGGVPGYFDSCIFENNNRAMVASSWVRKSQFINNGFGIVDGWNLDGSTNPNSFVGNGLAVQSASDARHNWWGHPTGPNGPQNPSGQGDAVAGGVPVVPFRTAAPDFNNHPPVVHMERMYFVVSAGANVIINWTTIGDDVSSHRVLMSTGLDIPTSYTVVAANLPADASSFQITAPSSIGGFFVRVEAIDAQGQVGWDRRESWVDNISVDNDLVLPLPGPATHFGLGHPVPIDPNVSFFDEGWVLHDGQMVFESFGAAGVLPTVVTASSDIVRLALVNAGGITFSHYFAVRPDDRLGDEAPTVQLLSPLSGSISGGSTVPISWTAADDEGIRYVTIQASYDGGMTYHDVKRRLPGNAGTHSWKIPAIKNSIKNVRVRVVAEDLRFQVSSATSNEISIVPGGVTVIADINGDGLVNVDDLIAVINGWGACQTPACPADLNGNGAVDIDDLLTVINNWS